MENAINRPTKRQAKRPTKRRALSWCVALSVLLGACSSPWPVQLEGQGGSSTKTKIKVKLPY